MEITTQSFYGPQSASAQRYTTSFEGYHSCPKCDLMKRNRDRATLRIHLFQHYQSVVHKCLTYQLSHISNLFDRKHWEPRLNLVSPGPDAKEIKCDSPKCKKKVDIKSQ